MSETQTPLPPFTGRPLVKNPELFPKVNFLSGDFGKAVLAEFQYRGTSDFQDNSLLRVLSYDQKNDVVIGSNPFAVVLVGTIISRNGSHVATPADLECVLQSGVLSLRGVYVDSAVVLRDEDEPNSYLAKDLLVQLRARGSVDLPVMLLLRDLAIRYDQESPYGLAFTLKDSVQPVYAPVLNNVDGSRFTSDDVDGATGLPKNVGRGDRVLRTRRSGLSRLYMGSVLGLGASNGDLNDSGTAGLVCIVSAGGATK